MALTQEVRFARVPSGTRIAWARTGKGPPLVRAAHWMTHVEHDLRSAIWRPWIERLGRDVTLFRYDARGCGLSGRDEAPLSLESSREELEAVVDAAKLGRFALLGISTGAATAVAYAAAHPERVSHLVILGGFARGLLRRNPSAATVEYYEALLRVMELGWGAATPRFNSSSPPRWRPAPRPSRRSRSPSSSGSRATARGRRRPCGCPPASTCRSCCPR
ncbi:MAG: alpha/beta hydrolase [Sandaracinaceae bacterium]|nr:alpha/beta hydrolase [Sandaracinaceae bacterium]